MATPHCEANRGDIAQTVIMCGDPPRAKYLAERFLAEARCYNQIRGMLGFTYAQPRLTYPCLRH